MRVSRVVEDRRTADDGAPESGRISSEQSCELPGKLTLVSVLLGQNLQAAREAEPTARLQDLDQLVGRTRVDDDDVRVDLVQHCERVVVIIQVGGLSCVADLAGSTNRVWPCQRPTTSRPSRAGRHPRPAA